MRALTAAFALLLCVAGCGSTPSSGREGSRALFVGNSQTYVGNLPAVFSALAGANGHAISSDMIVRGGATLTERVRDGSIARALAGRRYDVLVLQERGGDLVCSFGPRSCSDSVASIKAIARLAKDSGVATVILLGSYHGLPEASEAIAAEEAAAAAEAGIAYVEVSRTLQRVRGAQPGLAWFDADGVHPGKDLTLLDAVLLHRQAFGALPDARAVAVSAPIYGVQSGLDGTLRPARAPAPRTDTRRALTYPADTLRSLLDALHATTPDVD